MLLQLYNIYKSKYKKVGVKGFLSDEGPMLETLDYTIHIGSTPTFLYFDLYLYSAYAAHYVYIYIYIYIYFYLYSIYYISDIYIYIYYIYIIYHILYIIYTCIPVYLLIISAPRWLEQVKEYKKYLIVIAGFLKLPVPWLYNIIYSNWGTRQKA